MSGDPSATFPGLQLIPAEIQPWLKKNELLARRPKQGPMSGRHPSLNKGFSVIFAEHRPYTPGDDIRDIDWRVYGRRDRFYIKQYLEETSLRATILLDASGSMTYAGDKAVRASAAASSAPLSKFAYAQRLAASLASLLIRQQDAVGLVTFDTAVRQWVRAASRPSHARRLLQSLDEAQPGGETQLAPVLHEIAARLPARGLVFILSDFFDQTAPLVEALHHFAHRQHEIVLVQIMAAEEHELPFRTVSEFIDLENPTQRLKLDPSRLRRSYQEALTRHHQSLHTLAGSVQARYHQLRTCEPFLQSLTKLMR
jgi:uncharacterized protein (DUF58 family)